MKTANRIQDWLEERIGIKSTLGPLARHLVPPDARWAYVFGSATLIAFVLQVVTGVGLAFLYQPSSGSAYGSLEFINTQAPLGSALRGMHFFGASAMVLLVGLHMIRVYLFAAFKYPREMSWVTGAVLLLFTLMMGFTGQLLRWDSIGVWSAIVGVEQAGRIPFVGEAVARIFLGGETVGGATLGRFFALHVFLTPALLFAFVGLHLYLVFHNGVSEPPKAGRPVDPATYRGWYQSMLEEKGVPFWPEAAWRDLAFGIVVIVAILLLGAFVGAPRIGDPPDPANINVVPRPDWYLLWIYALFALMPRNIETFFLAYGPLVLGTLFVAVPFLFGKGERSPARRPWSVAIVIFIVTVIIAFWHEGVKSPWSPDFAATPLPEDVVGSVGPDAAAGADLVYKKACLYCHFISGDGGHRGPDLTFVGGRMNGQELTVRIVNGGGNMPAFGSVLSERQLRDLVSFLQTRREKL